jgi:DNA repair exonuclease SbcCD ATPase subunit
MNVSSLRVRRTLTLAGAVAAVILGLAAIQAAAAWTASAAPLAVTPTSVTSIETRLLEEQARSKDLEAQLRSITGQTDEMTAALQAAQERIVADARQADDLAKDLAAATKKLKALEASIRKAAATRTKTAVATTSGGGSAPSHEDDEHEDDDD